MKKIISLVIILILITGCDKKLNDSVKPNNENINQNDNNNLNDSHNKTYNLFDKVYLKNDSKWIVLEDLGDEILLIKPEKGALVEEKLIYSKVSEYEEELKTSLKNLNVDVSTLKMRIPTSKDFEKYFKLDFSKETDGRVYGITLDSKTRNITKDWEYSSFWVKKDYEYISCKTSNGQVFCSMDEMESGEKWHVLVVLQVNKNSIRK